MKKTKLFLADDHAVFRKAMRVYLEQQSELVIVGEAGSGKDTLDALAEEKPDILLLDISLPDMPGSSVARQALERNPKLAIIVLTMHEEEYYAQDMIRLGVRGYVLKGSTGDELLAAIRAVREGGVYWDKAVVTSAVSSFAGTQKQRADSDELNMLTHREREICRLLAYGHTNSEIAAQLSISIRTVQTHRQNIMGKLNISSRAEIVAFSMRHGLFSPDK